MIKLDVITQSLQQVTAEIKSLGKQTGLDVNDLVEQCAQLRAKLVDLKNISKVKSGQHDPQDCTNLLISILSLHWEHSFIPETCYEVVIIGDDRIKLATNSSVSYDYDTQQFSEPWNHDQFIREFADAAVSYWKQTMHITNTPPYDQIWRKMVNKAMKANSNALLNALYEKFENTVKAGRLQFRLERVRETVILAMQNGGDEESVHQIVQEALVESVQTS